MLPDKLVDEDRPVDPIEEPEALLVAEKGIGAVRLG